MEPYLLNMLVPTIQGAFPSIQRSLVIVNNPFSLSWVACGCSVRYNWMAGWLLSPCPQLEPSPQNLSCPQGGLLGGSLLLPSWSSHLPEALEHLLPPEATHVLLRLSYETGDDTLHISRFSSRNQPSYQMLHLELNSVEKGMRKWTLMICPSFDSAINAESSLFDQSFPEWDNYNLLFLLQQ